MILPADSAMESFVRAIGWRANIRDSSIAVSQTLLNELMGLAGRPAHWTSDAVGTVSVEGEEKWLVQFRTFIDETIIWRMYERLDSAQIGLRFKFARRSVELNWDHVGYFAEWPSQWTSDSGGPVQRLVEVAQSSSKRRKKN
jgi:hypothetical protein